MIRRLPTPDSRARATAGRPTLGHFRLAPDGRAAWQWTGRGALSMLPAAMRKLACLALLCLCVSCKTSAPDAREVSAAPAATASSEEERARKEQQLADAQAALARAPKDEECLIWVGRRLAYLERFDEAQEVYTRGLELHPESWKLLRHRGHRWITLRQFDRAVDDLSRAWQLARGVPDEVEPDGQPNAAGVPIGSYHSNIIYHLALAHYLRGEWEAACEVWEQGRDSSGQNDDRLCSSTYWNALALTRAGRKEQAGALLQRIEGPMTILENESYHQLCLLLKGERAPDQLLRGVTPGTTEHATRAFGVACWHRFRGEQRRAMELLELVAANGPRNAFGCIAAEADLARDAKR